MDHELERRQNAEANRFAIELLMPARLVITAFCKLVAHPRPTEKAVVESMARLFEVSEVMMTARLVELGLMMAP